MNTFEAMAERRSIRKFRPEPVSAHCLREIVEIARLYPSGGNLQPIRFAIVTDPALTAAIFADLRWAAYLPDYKIEKSERPTAYLILLRDENVRKKCDYDVGAASTMAMLAATEKGLATCPIANFHAANLAALLKLPENLQPELVLAVGYPDQESRVVSMSDTVRYSRDEAGTFLVPKWSGAEITVFEK